MALYRRLPKRGFKPISNNNIFTVINLSNIQEMIKKNSTLKQNIISLKNLQKAKLINKKYKKLKILGSGDLKEKLNVEVNSISKSAKEKIEKLGGKVTLTK